MNKSWLIFCSALVLSGCKREERGFRVNPPEASVIQKVSLSTLFPGGSSPPIPVSNEYEENAYAVSEGQNLYNSYNCVGCHAHGGGGMGPALMDDKWIYGSKPDQIFATIIEGRPNGMPSFRGKIPAHQVWQIAAYVRSMSGLLSANVAPGRQDHMHMGSPENSRSAKQPRDSTLPKSAEMP